MEEGEAYQGGFLSGPVLKKDGCNHAAGDVNLVYTYMYIHTKKRPSIAHCHYFYSGIVMLE